MARMRIKDIAEEAGVSPATVSRYLNNRPGQMTEETRARIAEVIERTGYRPRVAARNLRSGRSHALGVVLADIANPFSSAMLEELSVAAAARGYSLMTAISGNDPARESEAMTRLVDAGVDGIVLNACGGNDDAIATLAHRLPVVLLDRAIETDDIDLVTSNNAELVAGLVDELHACGCESYCLITEDSDTSPVRRERAEAFLEETERLGLAGHVVSLGEDASELDRIIVDAAGKKLGLICVNGLVLLRFMGSLAKLGLVLPEGLRVATFDDYLWNSVLFGGITTAAQDTHAIALEVMGRLAARIDSVFAPADEMAKLEPRRIEIPGHIITRASTRA